ncbi:MAG: VOC family protein [Candidatus Omnitrophota bacterium]
MNQYSIEHIGIAVDDPLAMAQWYEENLGYIIKFSEGNKEKGVAFISDASGKVTFELLKVPEVKSARTDLTHRLQVHVGVFSENPDEEARTLEAKGAKFVERCTLTLPGDYLVILEDPWGNYIQLVRRSRKF